jgi:hypothetical protein
VTSRNTDALPGVLSQRNKKGRQELAFSESAGNWEATQSAIGVLLSSIMMTM